MDVVDWALLELKTSILCVDIDLQRVTSGRLR
jgi:hypothetical protein